MKWISDFRSLRLPEKVAVLGSLASIAAIPLAFVSCLSGPPDKPPRGGPPASMQTSGNNSPIVSSNGDVVINIEQSRPDFVTNHEGAGALLMLVPDYSAMARASLRGTGPKVIGRIINGTSVQQLELKSSTSLVSPPWAKVRILEGDYKGRVGWIVMSSLRKPY